MVRIVRPNADAAADSDAIVGGITISWSDRSNWPLMALTVAARLGLSRKIVYALANVLVVAHCLLAHAAPWPAWCWLQPSRRTSSSNTGRGQ